MEVLPLPRCCPTLRGLRLGTLIPNKCTLQAFKAKVAKLPAEFQGGILNEMYGLIQDVK